ncbi:MAG: hypothetical protein ACOYL3_16245 [Desulfuromonadaceae bacterium]
MSDRHPTCPKCKGLLKYEAADIVSPERVTCILCGWGKTRSSEQTQTSKLETTMAKITHGTCNHCKRENVNMPFPGKCSRCYDRMKRGVDIFTGEPVPTEPAPAILADDEPPSDPSDNRVKHRVKPSTPPLRAHDYSSKRQKTRVVQEPAPLCSCEHADLPTCSIDLAAVIDTAWQYRRSVMLQRLSECPAEDERFILTCDFISEIRGMVDGI